VDEKAEALKGSLVLLDWLVVALYFLFTLCLGIYFGKRQTSSEHYFMANRKVPGWAVGVSLFATVISSWAFLALPGKAFKSDLQYLVSVLPIPLVIATTAVLIIPIYRNKVKLSAYEYLERRFGLIARFYGNIAFLAGHFFKLSVVLYLLCLAIAGMTGWPLIPLIVFVGLITLAYTFVGGVEGVIWTDVAQGFLMVLSAALAIGFLLLGFPGGPDEAIQVAYEGSKFKLADFSFDWNKESVYILLVFGFIQYMGKYSTDQTVVQRYLLSPSTKKAASALWLSVFLLLFIWIVFMFVGCLLWAFYHVHADLLPEVVRRKPDQVFAYFIGHQMPPGLSGLILAGILAASMSTIASDLNSLGSVLLDDFYNKLRKHSTEKQKLWFSKMSVLVAGILAIFIAMALTKNESMVETAFSFSAVMAGGLMGLFFLGFFTRRCSRKGATIGLVCGVTFITWATYTNNMDPTSAPWLPKFTIHLYWLGLLGNVVVFVTGYLASLIFTPNFRVDESLTIYSNGEPATAGEGVPVRP